jgi:hypothetical protein
VAVAAGKTRGGGSTIEGLREGRLGDVVFVDTDSVFNETSTFDIREVGAVFCVEKESLGILKKGRAINYSQFYSMRS